MQDLLQQYWSSEVKIDAQVTDKGAIVLEQIAWVYQFCRKLPDSLIFVTTICDGINYF